MVEAVFGARREPWSGRPLGTRCVVYIYYIRVKELRRVGEEGSPTTIRHCCVSIFSWSVDSFALARRFSLAAASTTDKLIRVHCCTHQCSHINVHTYPPPHDMLVACTGAQSYGFGLQQPV